jgi:hypothetical protein
MNNANMTNGNNARPSSQRGQRPDDNPQTNNCVAAGPGVNCSSPTPNSSGMPGPSK